MNTASHIIRRAKRTAMVEQRSTSKVEAATRALRGLSSGIATPTEARNIADRYCRVMRMELASEAMLDYLCSADSAGVPIEELDAVLMSGDDGFAAAHDAIGRARRTP